MMQTKNRKSGNRARGIVKCALALAMSLMLPVLTLSAHAASDSMPDPERKGSLSITFAVDGEPISGGNKVGLYKVADVVADNGYKFVYRDAFAKAGEVPQDLDAVNASLAGKLNEIAQDNRIELYTASKELDRNGKVTFTNLEPGLYMVVHTYKTEITLTDKTTVTYTINPFLVSIPQNNDGTLTYDVMTKPKVAPAKKTTPPPKKPPLIPQTGQLWWPVMALGGAGIAFLVFGMIRKTASGNRP